jgi:hypothetical protein
MRRVQSRPILLVPAQQFRPHARRKQPIPASRRHGEALLTAVVQQEIDSHGLTGGVHLFVGKNRKLRTRGHDGNRDES